MARILSQRLLQSERAASFFRLLYLPALFILALVLRQPSQWGIIAGLQGLAVLGLLCGYSVYTLLASTRGSFPARLCYLSVVLDAAGAAVVLYHFLGLPPTIGSQAAVAASEAFFFVPLVISVLRLRPLNTLAAALSAAIGSALSAVFFFLPSGRIGGIERPAVLSWLLLIAGAGCALVSRSIYRLLEENTVTDQFLRASRRLRMTFEIVQVSILNLSQWVNDLEKISGALALGARSQAGSVDRITTLALRMKTAMEAVSSATARAASTVKNALVISTIGQKTVSRLLDQITAVNEAVRQMTGALELINEISDHTNLLALNASIEASKTGEPSAGFSVMAGEIRSLAKSSSETAGEISRLVNQSSKAILESGDASRETAEVFDKICRDLSGFDGFVGELKKAVAEQMGAGDEVGASLEKIRDVAGGNSQAAERVKQVVAELKNEVVKLKALLEDKLVEASGRQAASSAHLHLEA